MRTYLGKIVGVLRPLMVWVFLWFFPNLQKPQKIWLFPSPLLSCSKKILMPGPKADWISRPNWYLTPQALNRKKLIASRRRYERACTRIVGANVTFHEKGGTVERGADFFSITKNRNGTKPTLLRRESTAQKWHGIPRPASGLPRAAGALVKSW